MFYLEREFHQEDTTNKILFPTKYQWPNGHDQYQIWSIFIWKNWWHNTWPDVSCMVLDPCWIHQLTGGRMSQKKSSYIGHCKWIPDIYLHIYIYIYRLYQIISNHIWKTMIPVCWDVLGLVYNTQIEHVESGNDGVSICEIHLRSLTPGSDQRPSRNSDSSHE